MPYSGSCHCGAIAFSVAEDPPASALSCNCSHCRRKGLLLSIVPASRFQIVGDASTMQAYYFYKHQFSHRICTTCGCEPFSLGKDEAGHDAVAVNLRCVPSIDLESLSLQFVDGAKR